MTESAEASAGPSAGRGASLPSRPPAIEADGLGWTYAGRSRPALAGLTFRLEPGRTLLVLGPSGSGKSTLARALAGLVPHTLPGTWQGRLRVGDMDVERTPARFLGEHVGLVFQDPDCQLVMARVDDEVAFGLENRGWPRPRMEARVPEALAQVGLGGFDLRGTATLSGGEKQRLAIADVIAARPSLIVLDEPTANLDPPGMYDTLEQLAVLARRREHTIVLIEHRLEAALPMADDVLLIDDEGRQLTFASADCVGRRAVSLLRRSGAWVPSAWSGVDVPAPAVAAAAETIASRPVRRLEQALLQAVDLVLDYPSDESGAHRALDGVSLDARSGERIAIVGPNGAGKSTLLFVLCGLRRPTRGRVGLRSIAGAGGGAGGTGEELRDPSRLRAGEIASRIGLVFQDPELGFVARTARDEVAATELAARTGRGRALPPPDSDGVLARFGLGELAGQDPFRLSQGEQRRLSLAALVIRPPAVLLLDEPTFGLDRRGTEAVMTLLDELRATGQAQLLATHDPRLLPHCDRVVALDRGRVVFDGSPERFLAEPPYSPAEPWRSGTGSGAGPAAGAGSAARGGPALAAGAGPSAGAEVLR
jgi:energy-coupling factor transport system ATP-binding protein